MLSKLEINTINNSIRLKKSFTIAFINWDKFKSQYYVFSYIKTNYGYRVNKAKARLK